MGGLPRRTVTGPLGSARLGPRAYVTVPRARTRARHHVDTGHVLLVEISENGITLT